MQPKDRSTAKEFFIGTLPAQVLHFFLYVILYFLFVMVCQYKIFESLPIHRVAANTPVLGFSFVLTGIKVLNFTERMDENGEIILPENLFLVVFLVFIVLFFLCFVVCRFCYSRGVFLNERERKEMLQGVQRKKKGSFTR